jgi:hypothetical protein
MGPADNPYAAPAAELQQAPAQSARGAAFYAMSARKVAVMSLLTMSLYELWFWWRHWRALRDNGEDISVFWRTVFATFYIFPFKNKVVLALTGRDLRVHSLLGPLPALYLASYVLDNIFPRALGAGTLAVLLGLSMSALRAALLWRLQDSVNQVLDADGYRGPVNRGARGLTYLAAGLGLLLWLATLFGTLAPTTQASA